MLRFLLDEHISPEVAEGLRRRASKVVVQWLGEWEAGGFLGLPDDQLLEEAGRQKLTLVTYDRRTIPLLLVSWAEQSRDHAGVVFVDLETMPPSDFGSLIRGLHALWKETRQWDWTNRIVTLRR